LIDFQTYAVGLCQSFCELLQEITTEGQIQVLKVLSSFYDQQMIKNPLVKLNIFEFFVERDLPFGPMVGEEKS
jgi:hypothetical protein